VVAIGGTFYCGNERNSKEHLYVVISKPDREGKILAVNVTEYYDNNPYQDNSCVLEAGCHPAIRKRSRINYADAFAFEASGLTILLDLGVYTSAPKFNYSIVKRIQDGARKSDALKLGFASFFDFF
jgi:hypothetical protein